jgi:hypothetical protein
LRSFDCLACHRVTGQPFRQGCRRRRRITWSETPAVRCCAQRQIGEFRSRSLSMRAWPQLPPKTNEPLRERTPWGHSRRPSTSFRVQIENEPSSVAMSSAMNSNLANAGSGDYQRGGETRQNNRRQQRADPCRSRSAAGGPLSHPLPPFPATPRSPSPTAMAKNVVRDFPPDAPTEPMHRGLHETGAVLRREDCDRASCQTDEHDDSQNDAP